MKTIVAIHEAKASVVDNIDASIKPTTFKFSPLYSGGPAFIDGFDAPAYVDLATMRVDPAPKALLEHDMDAVVGRLENIENDGKRVDCDAVVGGNALAAKVVEWAKNVAAWSCSIGVYRVEEKDVEFVKKGATARVNEREVVGPAYIVHHGSLAEGSFVAIGGDGEAATLLAKFKHKGGSEMSVKNDLNKKQGVASSASDQRERCVHTRAAARKGSRAFAAAGVEDEDENKVALPPEDDDKKDDATAEDGETGAEPLADETLEQIVEDAVETAVENVGEAVPEEVVEEVVDEIVDEIEGEETDPVQASARAEKLATKKIAAKLRRLQATNGSENRTARAAASATLKENRRVAGIKTLCGAYGKDGARVAASAISKGWSLERTERIMNAKKRNGEFTASLRNPGFGSAGSSTLRKQDVVAAAFAQTLGMSPKRAQKALKVDERVINASMEKPYRDISFRGVVAASLNSFQPGAYDAFTGAASGWDDCRRECMRASLTRGASFRATANFSTISATDVFQLVLQAFLEPSEETAPRLYPELTRENKVVDFNEVKSYLPTIQGRLRQISETGAIQNVTFSTEEFKRGAEAYGTVFTISEKTIINDQIDTFSELLRQLEQLGDDCLEHDVAETFWRLVDGDVKDGAGNALVSTTVGNYIASGTLDEAGLAAAIKALNSFSTANGVPLASDNLILVAGTALSPTARKLAQAGYVDFQNGTAYPNVFQGRFRPLEWAYLDSGHARATKDDGSTASLFAGDKTWILLRDPQRRPAVCVSKVLGFESPRIEQFDADPAVWGTTYRYVYPYGVSTQYKDAIVATTNS